MAIENLSHNFLHENETIEAHFRTEGLNQHLCNLSETIFQKGNELGEGNSAIVYADPEDNGLCYKRLNVLTRGRPINDLEDEAVYLDILSKLNFETKVPRPFLTINADVVMSNKKKIKQEILAMEKVPGHSLKDILDKKNGVDFPKNFNVDDFFTKLKKFVKHMNEVEHIYHLDLDDRNIMLDFNTLNPWIIDFGLSYTKVLSDENPYANGGIKDNEIILKVEERVKHAIANNI